MMSEPFSMFSIRFLPHLLSPHWHKTDHGFLFGASELCSDARFFWGQAHTSDSPADQRHPSSSVGTQVNLWRLGLWLFRNRLGLHCRLPVAPKSGKNASRVLRLKTLMQKAVFHRRERRRFARRETPVKLGGLGVLCSSRRTFSVEWFHALRIIDSTLPCVKCAFVPDANEV